MKFACVKIAVHARDEIEPIVLTRGKVCRLHRAPHRDENQREQNRHENLKDGADGATFLFGDLAKNTPTASNQPTLSPAAQSSSRSATPPGEAMKSS